MSEQVHDTKERLLDVAEELFAENGIGATSLRTITAAANANIASIHYYFGSKEALIREIFVRRATPINEERLLQLEKIEKEHDGPPLEKILEAFLGPILRAKFASDERRCIFQKLFSHVHAETPEIQELVFSIFYETFKRFKVHFNAALSHLSELTIAWRMKFMMGTVAGSMAPGPFFLKTQLEAGNNPDFILDALIAFLTAALKAPEPKQNSIEGE